MSVDSLAPLPEGFVSRAVPLGHDGHFAAEAMKRTPLQLELGDAEYARLARAWPARLRYAHMQPGVRFDLVPDSHVEDEDRADA